MRHANLRLLTTTQELVETKYLLSLEVLWMVEAPGEDPHVEGEAGMEEPGEDVEVGGWVCAAMERGRDTIKWPFCYLTGTDRLLMCYCDIRIFCVYFTVL